MKKGNLPLSKDTKALKMFDRKLTLTFSIEGKRILPTNRKKLS
jgi:hypothetical protein